MSVRDSAGSYEVCAYTRGAIPSGGRKVRMTEDTVQHRLEGAVRDLWTMLHDSGPDHAVFMDRRHMSTRVERRGDLYAVAWETEDGDWIEYERTFDNPREAAFHGYQGPH